MGRNFDEWFSTFRSSINSYRYYIDFEKVYENAKKLKYELYLLNSLIGSETIKEDFAKLLRQYPECVKAIPILLAVRTSEIYCEDEKGSIVYHFNTIQHSIEQYQYFMNETGLFDMLQKHVVNNLYDYVTGVEVGLDSNGRKNRGGDQMEDLVELFLKKANASYTKEMTLKQIEDKWNLDLSSISANGTSSKRWDFVVKNSETIYVIETNFYTSMGSKLGETARSYKMIAEESKNIPHFKFIWITDGKGWEKAKGNLKETFNTLPDLYNIADMENGVFQNLFE